MNKSKALLPGCLASLLVASAISTSCRQGREDAVEVSAFDISETILAADQGYRVAGIEGADTVYLDQWASVHWPVKMGDAELGALRDTLMAWCFADTLAREPKEAVRQFVGTPGFIDPGDTAAMAGLKIERIDSFPDDIDGMGCWFNNVAATVLELDASKVTYQIAQSSYFGGAHPVQVNRPFTYDLDNARVVTVGNMFRPGAADSVMPVIVNALARQLDVAPGRLRRAGIFTSQLTEPGLPYIYNNVVYFHYDPYEIAPYSMGMIDVAVYPYEIRHLLNEATVRLLDLGYDQ